MYLLSQKMDTTMKSIIFKFILIWLFLLYTPLEMYSQDTIQRNILEYQVRLEKYQKKWDNLIPMHTVFQYAGGMGLMSVGAGWSYGKEKQWETDIMLGVIPKYVSDKWKITMTIKQNYIPWRISVKKNMEIEPFECGIYFNTVFSDEFWTKEPDRYPDGYYGFSTRIRSHVFVGQRLRLLIPEKYRRLAKRVTLFYEISSCDLYIASAFTNHLNLDDYLRLSFGLKFQIF